jgi:hypothetical protein
MPSKGSGDDMWSYILTFVQEHQLEVAVIFGGSLLLLLILLILK